MKNKVELLAPGGDVNAIKAAIAAGADAVYCGLNKFNARNRATNISFDDLQGILRLAHKNQCQVFLTLNIIIVNSEIPALVGLLNKLVNTSIDGIIIQDLGLFYLLSTHFTSLKIHASTQFTTHNEGQIRFLSKLNTTRVNLSRELNIHEIKDLTSIAHNNNVQTEVFVHGSYCISFSGICYMSSLQSSNSGNRGRCSQPCRDQYETTSAGKDYPLNLKDNSAYFDLKELAEAGVDALKIEGRIKQFDYVYTVVNTWREQINSFYDHDKLIEDNSDLYKVFNRDFSNAFLKGEIGNKMFIDNPRDFSVKHLSEVNDYNSDEELEKDSIALFKEKDDIKLSVENKINQLSIDKAPLKIIISGKNGSLLKVTIKTPDDTFTVLSKIKLSDKGTEPLNYEIIFKKLKALDDTEYYIQQLILNDLQDDVYLPFKELTSLKKRLLFILNDSKEFIDPIQIPALKKKKSVKIQPALSVLISSKKDLDICDNTTADIYFQLPSGLKNESAELKEIFIQNKKLIPWFPCVLIGEDYTAAVEFLGQVKPNLIVTNNTGIAFVACEREIPWIAGPYLNSVNSYSLLNLKENFKCSGAFISNEINQEQIRSIRKPDDFNLYFSIYHPIELMTSRQCLFHQVTGCEKHKIEYSCISSCEKSASIKNLKGQDFIIDKSKGNYHKIYNATNYLNTNIVTDFPDLFSDFLINLTEIKTETKIEVDKLELIELFENLLNGNPDAASELHQEISPTTSIQYDKGI